MKNNKKKSNRKLILAIVGVVIVLVIGLAAIFVATKKTPKTDKDIVMDYLANKDADYTDEQKIEIVTAYKNFLETEGEDAVDMLISREEQMELTYMGMPLNVFVFRDYKNYGYLNADDSFMDVADYNKIAGFDVNATVGSDGLADIKNVEIVIDDQSYATADLTEEIAYFFERFDAANTTEKVTTIYGVDTVDVDSDTRLYITYMDVQYNDNKEVTALRVSGHLCMK